MLLLNSCAQQAVANLHRWPLDCYWNYMLQNPRLSYSASPTPLSTRSPSMRKLGMLLSCLPVVENGNAMACTDGGVMGMTAVPARIPILGRSKWIFTYPNNQDWEHMLLICKYIHTYSCYIQILNHLRIYKNNNLKNPSIFWYLRLHCTELNNELCMQVH